MTIFDDFLKYWEILSFFTVALYSRLMVHVHTCSKSVFWYLERLAMKISEGGKEGGGPFKRMDHAQLIQGFSDQTKLADAHFLVSVVEFTPFCLLVLVLVVAD